MNIPAPRDVLSEIRADHSHHPIGGGASGAVVLAEIPADWFLARNPSGHRAIMRPTEHGGVESVMVQKYTRLDIWAIFEAALTGKDATDG